MTTVAPGYYRGQRKCGSSTTSWHRILARRCAPLRRRSMKSASARQPGTAINLSELESTAVRSLDAGTGNITLISGTYELISNVDSLSDNSTLVVDTPAVVNLASAEETVGGLACSGTVAFMTDGVSFNLRVGGNNQDTTFSGNLAGNDTGDQDAFIKDRHGLAYAQRQQFVHGRRSSLGGQSVRHGQYCRQHEKGGGGRWCARRNRHDQSRRQNQRREPSCAGYEHWRIEHRHSRVFRR